MKAEGARRQPTSRFERLGGLGAGSPLRQGFGDEMELGWVGPGHLGNELALGAGAGAGNDGVGAGAGWVHGDSYGQVEGARQDQHGDVLGQDAHQHQHQYQQQRHVQQQLPFNQQRQQGGGYGGQAALHQTTFGPPGSMPHTVAMQPGGVSRPVH